MTRHPGHVAIKKGDYNQQKPPSRRPSGVLGWFRRRGERKGGGEKSEKSGAGDGCQCRARVEAWKLMGGEQ